MRKDIRAKMQNLLNWDELDNSRKPTKPLNKYNIDMSQKNMFLLRYPKNAENKYPILDFEIDSYKKKSRSQGKDFLNKSYNNPSKAQNYFGLEVEKRKLLNDFSSKNSGSKYMSYKSFQGKTDKKPYCTKSIFDDQNNRSRILRSEMSEESKEHINIFTKALFNSKSKNTIMNTPMNNNYFNYTTSNKFKNYFPSNSPNDRESNVFFNRLKNEYNSIKSRNCSKNALNKASIRNNKTINAFMKEFSIDSSEIFRRKK